MVQNISLLWDLQAGFNDTSLNDDSVVKTAFMSPFGKYEYLNIPFGLAQALPYFQELINKVLKDLTFTIAY